MSYTISNFLNSSLSSGTSSTSGSWFSNISFSDYASIRNGSYYKLLKTYYSSTSQSSDSDSSSSSVSKSGDTYNYWDYNDQIKKLTSSTAVSADSTSTLSGIQTDSSELTKAVDKLESTESGSPLAGKTTTDYSGNKKTEYDMDAAYKAVESYVTEYNSLLQSTASSKVGAITAARSSIVGYTGSSASQLNEIGITVNAKDNSLSIDKDKFQSADMETIQELFQGKNSYASKVSATASAIGDYAKYEAAKAATYNNTGAFSYNYASAWNGYI